MTDFAVIYAAPIIGSSGIMTKGVHLALERAAAMFAENRIEGIAVVASYGDSRKSLVTKKMADILMKKGVPEEKVVQVPYRKKDTTPLQALIEKFSITNEFEDAPRSSNTELTLVVPANVSQHFCIKPYAGNGLRIRGYPVEVEVPFSLLGFLENLHYFFRNCAPGS